MIVAHGVLPRSVEQFVNHVHDGLAPISCGEPEFEGLHARRKLLRRAGAVHLPHLLVQLASLATTVTNFKKAVQEAQDHGNRREQNSKRILGREPTVGVHGSGSVIGFHVLAFRLKDPVRLGQMLLVRRFGQRHPQRTFSRRRKRDVALFATPIDVVLIRDEVFGQPAWVTHRGTDEAVAAQPFQMPMPEHLVVTEDVRHHPAGRADREQQQGMFEFFHRVRHITEDKTRSQGKAATIA